MHYFLSCRALFTSVLAAIATYFVFIREPNLQPNELNGKNVFITGASAGIGEQMAYHYARAGAKIFLVARRNHILQKVTAKCLELGAQQVAFYSADLGLADNIAQVVDAFAKDFYKLDHLILNHKLENHMGPWKGSAQNLTQLENIFSANYFAYVRLASALLQFLERAQGTIGIVSSAAGRSSTPYIISYSSSKHALDGFFNGWSLELQAAKSPVSITFCTLGCIDTENMRREIEGFDFANSWLLFSGAVNASDTAEAIITAVARKRRELFYPWAATRVPLIFRFWFPELFDQLNGFILRSKFT